MIICFECDPEIKGLLDRLIQDNKYKDFGEAISAAIRNLVILQEQISKRGVLIFETDSNNEREIDTAQKTGDHREETINKKNKYADSILKESKKFFVPDIFKLNNYDKQLLSLANMPMDLFVIGDEVPLDRWIFGQYNRLLPTKVSCRAFVNLTIGEPNGVELDVTANEIAKNAAVLGEYLSYIDEKMDIDRDDALSTAFPTQVKNSEKSQARYANQFVCSVNKQGQASGLLIDLKLINRLGGKKTRIQLTEPGLKYAMMHNPILDSSDDTVTSKFYDEEVFFLLNHISTQVPSEDFAYRVILDTIINKANTPDEIDKSLAKYVSKSRINELSQSFLSSQRSGAISRMSDLGLVERVRDGVWVKYKATKRGIVYTEK